MADKLALTQNRKARERAKKRTVGIDVRLGFTVGAATIREIQESYLAGYRSRRAEERRERKS